MYRVGAIMRANQTTVWVYGFGLYLGELRPPDNILSTLLMRGRHPCIRLDNGRGYVWGCQCWWGPEAQIRAVIGERTEVLVDPPENQDPPPEDCLANLARRS